jgi:ribosomal protein L40E
MGPRSPFSSSRRSSIRIWIITALLQYLYIGDYTSILGKDGEKNDLNISTLQLHARVFALADKYAVQGLCDLVMAKYYSRLKDDFNTIEFLESIPDVYHSTPPEIDTLRVLAIHFARKHLEKSLQDRANKRIYDHITSEVPTFTKRLLDSYIASPIEADCVNCGPIKPMQALQVRCRKCGRGSGFHV